MRAQPLANNRGFSLLEVVIATLLMAYAGAGLIAFINLMKVPETDVELYAGMLNQSASSKLYGAISDTAFDTPGSVWDPNFVQPPEVTVHNGVTYSTQTTVFQAPGGRTYRYATIVTTCTT